MWVRFSAGFMMFIYILDVLEEVSSGFVRGTKVSWKENEWDIKSVCRVR